MSQADPWIWQWKDVLPPGEITGGWLPQTGIYIADL